MHFSQYFLMELQNISIPIEGHTKNIVNRIEVFDDG